MECIDFAITYADKHHHEKEDTVCYTYALRTLPEECQTQIDEQTRELEKKAEQDGIQEKYLAWLEKRQVNG